MQEEIKIRGNKSHFQRNLYLCWNRGRLMEQGDTGGLRKLGRTESKLRFQFCKQLRSWLIGAREPGSPFPSRPQTLKARHPRVGGTGDAGDAARVSSAAAPLPGTAGAAGARRAAGWARCRPRAQPPAGWRGRQERGAWRRSRGWVESRGSDGRRHSPPGRPPQLWRGETAVLQNRFSPLACPSSPRVTKERQQK